jgi:hypothetical protein
MIKYDIGIDPDSAGNGAALYTDGKLTLLKNLSAAALTLLCIELQAKGENRVRLHMEDVKATSAVFKSRFTKGETLESKLMKAQNLGMCKQAQTEIEMMAEMLGIEVFTYQISKRWKCQQEKTTFQRATGWTGRSNEDTRSAAYFGFLGVRRGEAAVRKFGDKAKRKTNVQVYPK